MEPGNVGPDDIRFWKVATLVGVTVYLLALIGQLVAAGIRLLRPRRR